MQCPVCASAPLQQTTLEANLTAHSCQRCGGLFIVSTDYWTWLNQHDADLPEQLDPSPIQLSAESVRAKQCPLCRHLLLPYKVALDIPFTVDHCGSCNGMWFDQDEWTSLQRRNLHDDLHQIFAEPWQRRLRDAEHRARMQAIYLNKFGADYYAEARRVKTWLDAHPQRHALRAYLNADDPYLG